MTRMLDRITTLAAVLAPMRAGRLLSLVSARGAASASEHASDLASRPRRDRLAALAAVWGMGTAPSPLAVSLSQGERPGTAADILLARLVRDALRVRDDRGAGRPEVPMTPTVRATTRPPVS